jgi:hypothetical protein
MSSWSDFEDAAKAWIPSQRSLEILFREDGFSEGILGSMRDRAEKTQPHKWKGSRSGAMMFDVHYSSDSTSWAQLQSHSDNVEWGRDARLCSEDKLWDIIKGGLRTGGFLVIAQTKPPCLRCQACYRTMADIQNRHVLVYCRDSGEGIGDAYSMFIYTPSGRARRIK